MPIRLAEQRCVELKRSGLHYSDIAMDLGITPKRAEQLVKRSLAKDDALSVSAAAAMRSLQLQRLEEMHAAIYPHAKRSGKMYVAMGGLDVEAVVGPDYRAVDKVLSIMERQAKLMGLDAEKDRTPAGVTVNVSYVNQEQLQPQTGDSAGQVAGAAPAQVQGPVGPVIDVNYEEAQPMRQIEAPSAGGTSGIARE